MKGCVRYGRTRTVEQRFLMLPKPQKYFQEEAETDKEFGFDFDAPLWY